FLRGATTAVGPGGQGPAGIEFLAAPSPSRGVVVFRGAIRTGNSSDLRLMVQDAAGRKVAEIPVSLTAGRFEVQWFPRVNDGGRLPAGVYFARLSAGGTAVTRTVVLTNSPN